MSPIDHFSYGLVTPVLAYVMSSVGSMLGLLLTSRARLVTGKERGFWLVGAAIAIGGTGIWTMHFIAMMGFGVRGTMIRYDVPLTAASAFIAVVVVGAGLFLVSFQGERLSYLLGGGLLTGVGVAGMHYLGMIAMNMSGHISYDPLIVTLSVVIAIAASTVALWFTLRVTGALKRAGAALIMGFAVTGMHYTGMFAMAVEVHGSTAPLTGSRGIDFLLPLIVGISLVTLGLLLAVMLSPSERELRGEEEFLARLEKRRNDEGAPQVNLFGTPRG
ncbi:MHYT domain-containing protein [Nonomuraea sp. NPDC048916]|uniref:MHYT domain-containing protein n=1 Tax=Nonomuraea sp. NPDC048916 TaxID=3154232 RepID=UPI003409E16F